jgi:ABC-2 type transport system permease protein
LPLTHFNNAMRDIAFEGNSLLQSWGDISILLIWILFVYAFAFKIFKWE